MYSTELPKDLRYRLLRLKKAICAKFTESNWEEMGLVVGCTQMINSEDRLYRSLSFGDPDYEGHVISVLERIARKDVGLVDEVEKYVMEKFSTESLGDVCVEGLICKPSVFSVPKEPINPKLIALMIPFAAEFEAVTGAIKTASAECGMVCERANDIWEDFTIIQDVFSLIYRARIVVCDFSNKNPNVFYEAGIAHTLGRAVIPMARSVSEIPFDLRHHRHLIYLPNEQGISQMKVELKTRIMKLLENGCIVTGRLR